MDAGTIQMILQGGFAGIVALLLWQGFKREDRMASNLDDVQKRSISVIENNTRAMTELTMTLNDRPCLRNGGKDGA
jgi:hypothetical protein